MTRLRSSWCVTRPFSVALALVLLSATALVPVEVGAATPMKWEFISTNRAAVWNDGSDALTVKIKTSGPVKKVIVDDMWGDGEGLHAGDQVGRIRLYDDGTHGDAKAGDSMFTRSGVSVRASWDWSKCIWVELHSASGAVKKSNWSAFQVLALDRKHEVTLTKLDGYMRVSGRVANLKVSTDVYQPRASRWMRKAIDLKTVTKRFYRRFPDRYHFLTIWNQEDVLRNYPHYAVRNNVRGIGLSRFDRTTSWGSKGRLQGVNFLGRTGGDRLVDETVNQWAAFLDAMRLSQSGFWRYVNVRGYRGGLGFKWVSQGRYKITWVPWDRANDHRLPPLELYLAGLAKRTEVPKVKRLVGINPNRVEVGNVVRPNAVVTKSIDKIIKRFGQRRPNYARAQKAFRMGSILITTNRFATPAEMTAHHLSMAKFGGTGPGDWNHPTTYSPSWDWVTNGRSTMNTQLGARK